MDSTLFFLFQAYPQQVSFVQEVLALVVYSEPVSKIACQANGAGGIIHSWQNRKPGNARSEAVAAGLYGLQMSPPAYENNTRNGWKITSQVMGHWPDSFLVQAKNRKQSKVSRVMELLLSEF